MPTDPEMGGPKTLAWWIDKLVDALEREPTTALRIRQVVGHQRARVQLDAEAVIVEFDAAGQLLVRTDDTSIQVDGDGFATREEVCAILKAKSEAGEAVLSGRVAVRVRPTPWGRCCTPSKSSSMARPQIRYCVNWPRSSSRTRPCHSRHRYQITKAAPPNTTSSAPWTCSPEPLSPKDQD